MPTRRWPRPSPSRPDPLPCVQPVRQHGRPGGGGHPRPPHRGRHRTSRRTGLLRQLGGRGQRVRHQAGPSMGRTGTLRRGEHLGRVPRPDPGHPGGHRPARQAAGLPAHARRLRPRALRRPRCHGRRLRSRPGGRRPGRADPRRGRSGGAVVGLPGRAAPALHRPGHPADGGRGPDRPGSHRALVRLPAPRGGAGHRDHGQGPGQRHAGRRVLGPGRGGRRLRAR